MAVKASTMPPYRLVAAMKSPSGDEFLVVRQPPPPPLPEEEYRSFLDSELWDLPSAPLNPLEGDLQSEVVVEGADSLAQKVDLSRFDVRSALDQVLKQVELVNAIKGKWKLLKYVEEAEFGPEPFVHSFFVIGSLEVKEELLQESCKWMSYESVSRMLSEVKPSAARVGPLAYVGLLSPSAASWNLTAPPTLHYQEYPPGVTLVPMKSRTLKPFRTTNLVVILPTTEVRGLKDSSFIACGDALIIDPGCCSQVHAELADLIVSLPRKLVVVVTHHHFDHIEGLSIVQKCNPDAILLAHENTMKRIGKGNWSRNYTAVTGGEKISINGQQLEVIFSPGHTDGHLAVLHVGTKSLIVGDHCVGQGTAALDTRSGGCMKDYFQTTYKFLDISPHVIIPMHGRMNLWPKRMLCGYIKHRRDRESGILRSIENGAQSLYDIVSRVYGDLDAKLWLPAASNVKLHVEHLDHQKKLPENFSMTKFQASCRLHFAIRLAWAYLKTRAPLPAVAAIGLGTALALAYAMRRKSDA